MLVNDQFLKQMKMIEEQVIKALKETFKNEIKQSFLIEVLYKVKKYMGSKLYSFYDILLNNEDFLRGGKGVVEYEICKMIIGVHKSNTIFLSEEERIKLERSEDYKKKLTEAVSNHIRLRNYAAVYFRNKQITAGDRFLYFPLPYKLFAMCIKSLVTISNNSIKFETLPYYIMIYNKALSALSLVEDNFLDNAYPICRVIIEFYIKLILLESNPKLIDEHNKFAEYDLRNTCCGEKYSEAFTAKYKNRKKQSESNKVKFLHYGWLDLIDDYHDIVKQNSYSINGIIEYIEQKQLISDSLDDICHFYKMCHTYTHGNVGTSVYPLLNYFELTFMLSKVLINTYSWLCEKMGVNNFIEEVDVLKICIKDFTLLQEQYTKRSTEKFNIYYSKHK